MKISEVRVITSGARGFVVALVNGSDCFGMEYDLSGNKNALDGGRLGNIPNWYYDPESGAFFE